MKIREALLAEHSKQQTMKIVSYIDGDADKFRELMDCFLGDSYRAGQRAAWASSVCAEHHPHLVKPYFSKFVEQLERDDVHVAVRRNVTRLLQFVEIPKRFQGRVFDACYNLFDDLKETIAVRVFAMTVAAKIAESEPELLEELRSVAKKYLPEASAGFKARARNILGVK